MKKGLKNKHTMELNGRNMPIAFTKAVYQFMKKYGLEQNAPQKEKQEQFVGMVASQVKQQLLNLQNFKIRNGNKNHSNN